MTKKRMRFKNFILMPIFLLFATGSVYAQENGDMIETYERAESLLSWNLNDKVYNSFIFPNQISGNTFWYDTNTRRGQEYYLIDTDSRNKRLAFDHQRLSEAVSELPDFKAVPRELKLVNLSFSTNLEMIRFERNNAVLECNIKDYKCERIADATEVPRFSVPSPDGKKAAFTREYNLWIKNLETGKETQLTLDGVKHHSYATDNHGWRRSERPILLWSPDSKKIATFRLDERNVGNVVLWRTQVGRPEADIWPYALPGDTVVPMLERVVIDTETQKTVYLDVEPDHQRTSNCCGLIRNGNWADVEWSKESDMLAFVSTSRDYKDVTLQIADPVTGEVTEVFSEHDELFFESNLTSRGVPNWRVLHDSNEFIWFTRKDNWGHLYLHDLNSGELINRITKGNWNVIDILRVDQENRTIYFSAVGMEEGRDPYFEHFYKIQFDGSGLTLLTPDNANHSVFLSDETSWFVNTYSTFTEPPVSVLRDMDGNQIMKLEVADIQDLLETGWTKPVPVTVKARDGETDLYGFMILPSNFDENKMYPVINSIYPGPQSGSIGSRSFSHSQRGQAHALAELGFVVVAIDALGSGPMRSRDFHTAYYGDMSDNGLPDQISAMKQLAERYPFIDIDRAGIYGHSGGGFATSSALFQYPDFFKVGVSSAGNHDNRNYTYYWGEKYQGLLKANGPDDNYANQAVHQKAGNLQGKLLLSYGSMDSNVHPSMTLLIVDELIRQNKDFDLLVMPNRGHGYSNEPYHIRRTWDYFVKHLLGKTPPLEYQIKR
ncbi:MAG: DPP IV N-terminal domain-containing protein [Balneolaceae bacterium]